MTCCKDWTGTCGPVYEINLIEIDYKLITFWHTVKTGTCGPVYEINLIEIDYKLITFWHTVKTGLVPVGQSMRFI